MAWASINERISTLSLVSLQTRSIASPSFHTFCAAMLWLSSARRLRPWWFVSAGACHRKSPFPLGWGELRRSFLSLWTTRRTLSFAELAESRKSTPVYQRNVSLNKHAFLSAYHSPVWFIIHNVSVTRSFCYDQEGGGNGRRLTSWHFEVPAHCLWLAAPWHLFRSCDEDQFVRTLLPVTN